MVPEEESKMQAGTGVGRRVCMFVFNNFTHDSRVLKEAKTLVDAGYDVRVVAFRNGDLPSAEVVEGFRVVRIDLAPVHLRALSWLRTLSLTPLLSLISAPFVWVLNLVRALAGWVSGGARAVFAFCRRGLGALRGVVSSLRGAVTSLRGGAKEAAKAGSGDMGGWHLLAGWIVVPIVYAARAVAGARRMAKAWIDTRLYPARETDGFAIKVVRLVHHSWCKALRQLSHYWRKVLFLFWVAPVRMVRTAWQRLAVRPWRFGRSWVERCRARFAAWRKSFWRYQVVPRAKKCRAAVYDKVQRVVLRYHRPLSFLDFYCRSYKAVAHEPADIYQAHDLNTLPVAWWAARKRGVPLVYDSHELYLNRNRSTPRGRVNDFILARIERFLSHRCDAVITVNETIAKELAKRYGITEPHVLMNAPVNKAEVDASCHRALRDELHVPEERFLLLYCGGITFNRGLEKVIESLALLPDCHLVFMGYGTDAYKEGLMDVVRRVEVGDRFDFFGPVPSDMVTTYAACADLGVAPIENVCLSYYYCSPNKVFEYLNAGLPVVASDFPEMRRVIHEFQVGGVFDPADPQDIARAVRLIKDDAGLREGMRANTVKAAGLFNWENEAAKLLSIYRGLG